MLPAPGWVVTTAPRAYARDREESDLVLRLGEQWNPLERFIYLSVCLPLKY